MADFAALRKVASEAWDVVATSVRSGVSPDPDAATEVVATATFSERLLRDITGLRPDQQTALVRRLAREFPALEPRAGSKSHALWLISAASALALRLIAA